MIKSLVLSIVIGPLMLFGSLAQAQKPEDEVPVLTRYQFSYGQYSLPANATDADKIEMILRNFDTAAQGGGDPVRFTVTSYYLIPGSLYSSGNYSPAYSYISEFSRKHRHAYRKDILEKIKRICESHFQDSVNDVSKALSLVTNSATIISKLFWSQPVGNSSVMYPERRVEYVEFDKSPCEFDGRYKTIAIEIIVNLSRADYAAMTRGAPVMAAPKPAAPDPRGPVLKVKGPDPQPTVKGPDLKVYKPGERPVAPPPPVAAAKPCPKGEGPCATQLDGPRTAEGLARQRALQEHEQALRAYEAREAAARAAVEEENRKLREVYAEQLRRERERFAAAEAERKAKVDADRAAYNAELRAREAEIDRINREHEAKMAEWRRRVAACQAGDRTQCAP